MRSNNQDGDGFVLVGWWVGRSVRMVGGCQLQLLQLQISLYSEDRRHRHFLCDRRARACSLLTPSAKGKISTWFASCVTIYQPKTLVVIIFVKNLFE